jgi:large conductance mechanosensitive channel
MKGFLEFIRKQGVVGFAVGIILGGSVSKLITAFVNDLLNPLLGILLGVTSNLDKAYFQIGSAKFMWGDFLNSAIDFIIIALVVYFGLTLTRLDRLDKKK